MKQALAEALQVPEADVSVGIATLSRISNLLPQDIIENLDEGSKEGAGVDDLVPLVEGRELQLRRLWQEVDGKGRVASEKRPEIDSSLSRSVTCPAKRSST